MPATRDFVIRTSSFHGVLSGEPAEGILASRLPPVHILPGSKLFCPDLKVSYLHVRGFPTSGPELIPVASTSRLSHCHPGCEQRHLKHQGDQPTVLYSYADEPAPTLPANSVPQGDTLPVFPPLVPGLPVEDKDASAICAGEPV